MTGPSVKVSADWIDSDAIEGIGAEAAMLMLSALAWSARQLTEGRVPRRALRKLWPVPDVEGALAALSRAGEIEDDGETVYFPRWSEFILASAEVARIREKTRIRTERSRRHKAGDHGICQPKYCPTARESATGSATPRVSHGDPTGSGPNRSTPKVGGSVSETTESNCHTCGHTADECRRRAKTNGHDYQPKPDSEVVAADAVTAAALRRLEDVA